MYYKKNISYTLIFFFTLLLQVVTLAQASFQGIGDLPGGFFQSNGTGGVSADGMVVVGSSRSTNGTEAFRWENGVMTPLGDLPGGQFVSSSNDASVDGSVVVGTGNSADGIQAFRWTAGGGMVGLGDLPGSSFRSLANGVSADGSVVVGESNSPNGTEAFRWENGVMTGLGNLPGGGTNSIAYDVSADGSIVVGSSESTNGWEAFRWENNVMTGLGDLPGGVFFSSAFGVSADGSIVVGQGSSDNGAEAFRWENDVMTPLGDLPGGIFSSIAYDVSADGSVIVGWSDGANGTEAFIWTESAGMRSVKQVLESDYGLDLTGWTLIQARGISDDGTVIAGNGTNPNGDTEAWRAVLGITVISPFAGEIVITGTVHDILWASNSSIEFVHIEFSDDEGATYNFVETFVPADSNHYEWTVPSALSTKCKIKISDANNPLTFDESEKFKVKGYQLTKLDGNGDYIAYDINDDRWGFGNNRNDMWPPTWWPRFNYHGNDPFTGQQYSQWHGNFVFAHTLSIEFIDWISFVNAFTENVCYISTILALYSPTALFKWNAINTISWRGSCFGIAASNALAFSHKTEFASKFPSFPSFTDPITVTSDTNVIPVVTELFTHQFGNPTNQRIIDNALITPNQTLNEVKEMFSQDNVPIRTLAIYNNNGTGGHTILPYDLEQDDDQEEIYYLYVYDNSYPDSTNAFILIDTTGNLNDGTWQTQYAWSNWGGPLGLHLNTWASAYLNDPILPKNNKDFVSPFILSGDELEVYNNINANTRIIDSQGNLTGFVNGTVYNEITNSVPLIYLNGSETPPYGYYLPTDNYSIQISDVISDTIETFFFTGNKSYLYKRTDATNLQTDRLFFDGGVSAVNPDQDNKSISLVNIINESTQEKLYALRSLSLSQNDSVKIENVNDDQLKLISYGTSKNYDIELNFVSETGFGRFGSTGILLDENTTHIFLPDWNDIANSQLTILVDNGNNGTIDDTLFVSNTVDVKDEGYLGVPKEYNLAQNYPNPFNPVTKIRYSLPQQSNVSLIVYNILGQEVITLVNEQQPAGNYEVSFDATNLTSGIYLYKIQAGDYSDVKKMILLR